MKTKAITNIQNNIQVQQEIRILVNNKEVLDAAEEIIADELEVQNRNSKYCHKPAEIAKQFRMSGADLNSFCETRSGPSLPSMRTRATLLTSTLASMTSTDGEDWYHTWFGRMQDADLCWT